MNCGNDPGDGRVQRQYGSDKPFHLVFVRRTVGLLTRGPADTAGRIDGGCRAVRELKQRNVLTDSSRLDASRPSRHLAEAEPVWRERGACRGIAAAAFFPDEEDRAGIEFAKSVCAECTVRVMCLEYALMSKEKVGVWGGATERERRRIVRQRRRSA
jgi:WhiB family transcriptional regulator, redox-sensing transcriptional regulator